MAPTLETSLKRPLLASPADTRILVWFNINLETRLKRPLLASPADTRILVWFNINLGCLICFLFVWRMQHWFSTNSNHLRVLHALLCNSAPVVLKSNWYWNREEPLCRGDDLLMIWWLDKILRLSLYSVGNTCTLMYTVNH